MKLWMGVATFFVGFFLAVFGYAPILSSAATSLPMILGGGFALAAGTFLILFVSARSLGLSDRFADTF